MGRGERGEYIWDFEDVGLARLRNAVTRGKRSPLSFHHCLGKVLPVQMALTLFARIRIRQRDVRTIHVLHTLCSRRFLESRKKKAIVFAPSIERSYNGFEEIRPLCTSIHNAWEQWILLREMLSWSTHCIVLLCIQHIFCIIPHDSNPPFHHVLSSSPTCMSYCALKN